MSEQNKPMSSDANEQDPKPMNSDTHIHILLDRSGSMAAIASDVIGGFNTFLRDQQASGPDARITLVQFDSHNPQEVVLAGAPILEATPLDARIFVPRGGTPLLDATGRLITRARLEADIRAANGLHKEHIVVVSITDGEENQSREFDLPRVRGMIKACESRGWSFVFLSAGPDAYGEATRLGVDLGATQSFKANSWGTAHAMDWLSESMSLLREERRTCKGRTSSFFQDDKPAEQKVK